MLPKEVTDLIGKAGEPRLLYVEKGAIRKYADAVGDKNPLYWDEEYARKSRFGTMIAPPGFFGWPATWESAGPVLFPWRQGVTDVVASAGYPRGLAGGVEYDFYRPVRAGDVISATPQVKDIQEREGKAGKMAVVVIETTYVNQDGETVAQARETLIRR